MRVVAEKVVIGRQTGLQTKYDNRRCTCAPRVIRSRDDWRCSYNSYSASRRVRRSVLSPALQKMAAALLRCIRCTKTTDAAVRRQDEESEMRPFTGEDENEEEPGEVWETWRRVLVAALLLVMSLFVACAYSLLGSFFPIEVR